MSNDFRADIRCALALLEHGYADRARWILEDNAPAETQPAINMLERGDTVRAMRWLRDREQMEEGEG